MSERDPRLTPARADLAAESLRGEVSAPRNVSLRLEHAGGTEDRLPQASRSQEMAALKARSKSGQAREGDLLRYIELSMAQRS